MRLANGKCNQLLNVHTHIYQQTAKTIPNFALPDVDGTHLPT